MSTDSGEHKKISDTESTIVEVPLSRRILKKLIRFAKIGFKIFLYLFLPLAFITALVWYEIKTSRFQAKYLTRVAHNAIYAVGKGPSDTIWFPKFGPYDVRLGYTKIPAIVENLTRFGYSIAEQARISQAMKKIVSYGLYPTYKEKTRTGLTILDWHNTLIYSAYKPEYIYEQFDDIPKVILNSLLYIENREILDQTSPTKNPAVEWDRFALAIIEKIIKIVRPGLNAPGGSTIATQLEKYRHSKGGRTQSGQDKIIQMASASLRAYMYGEETTETRKQIVLQYINSIPLAALSGLGEVNGLGDGIAAWFGVDFDELNTGLKILGNNPSPEEVQLYAGHYKKALSLFIAHRRPSFYLLRGLETLDNLTNTYIDLLAREKIISKELQGAAKQIRLKLRRSAPPPKPVSFIQRKAANAIRTRLLQLLDYKDLYDLDQLDLTVKSTMDNEANELVSDVLGELKDEAGVKKYGLNFSRSLDQGDPKKVIYSLTMYERVGNANLLRIQTDNFNKPFSINEGTRLDLGSTAKLRTLVTYLDLVGEIYDRYKILKGKELSAECASGLDPISLFVCQSFQKNQELTLKELLDMAMLRTYSANPGESFFTGGGMHTFHNFRNEDNGSNPTVQQSLTNSINLPLIRLMRDIVRYHVHALGLDVAKTSEKTDETTRMRLLRKFADQEGSYFLKGFYKRYKGKTSRDLTLSLIKDSHATAKQAAVMYRYVEPKGSLKDFSNVLAEALPRSTFPEALVEDMYNSFPPGKYSLSDTGYLARVHPLELWLVRYLKRNPAADLKAALETSVAARQEVYQWLFKTPHKQAQDSRIRVLTEVEAFSQIHKQWQKVGYPFSSMVASYASSIGSSGDRPAALAELVGIILNDGVRYPLVRLNELHFGSNTPFETKIVRDNKDIGERVLKSEVAAKLREAMVKVVEEGTARRLKGAYKRKDGKVFVIGGKTGTGDHRHDTFGPGGQLLGSKVVNRTATFAFFLGDRYFGVISAHVPGTDAAKFNFTSALAAELLKALSPAVSPMLEASHAGTEKTMH